MSFIATALVTPAPQIPYVHGMEYLGSVFTPGPLLIKVHLTILGRLFLALVLGCLVGFTHGWRYHDHVGFRTYGAVAVGAAAFSSVCVFLYLATGQGAALGNFQGIMTGIGFLCGAVIFKEGAGIRGLSTAATVWATASIGVAAGAGLSGVALGIALIIVLFHLLPKRVLTATSED